MRHAGKFGGGFRSVNGVGETLPCFLLVFCGRFIRPGGGRDARRAQRRRWGRRRFLGEILGGGSLLRAIVRFWVGISRAGTYPGAPLPAPPQRVRSGHRARVSCIWSNENIRSKIYHPDGLDVYVPPKAEQ